MLTNINLWAALVAAIVSFFCGSIWYSKSVFGGIWCKEAKITEWRSDSSGHRVRIYIIAFILFLIASLVFAIMLGPRPSLGFATGVGFLVGLCWVATSFGINYLFAGRSWKLFLIDGGYHTLQFTVYGFILGLWH